MSEIIPMTSVRLGPGRYEVLGTSQNVEVRKAGACWAIYINGRPDTSHLFDTKKAALQYCQLDVEL